MTHCVRWEILEVEPAAQNTQLQIAAKQSVQYFHLANTNEELGGLAVAIPPSVRLLWSLSNNLADRLTNK